MSLSPRHLADLRASALTDATIAEAGLRTSTDPAEVARILGWDRPAKNLGPSLVIPYLDLHSGRLNGFARVKPDRPRPDGGKYEAPRGCGSRAYFTREFYDEWRIGGAKIVIITEGEKKALAIAQCGFAAIGLSGVWNAFEARSKQDSIAQGERAIIKDLELVRWQRKTVIILFDADPRRNPQVAHARAELARVLARHGAKVILADLPLGGISPDGLPRKMGADDFILAHGEQSFREFVAAQLSPPTPPVKLTDHRAAMATERIDSVGKPGLYLDTSPPGAGKTTAGIHGAAAAKTSLTVLPTHENCQEVKHAMLKYIDGAMDGIDVAAYPAISKKTCENYEEASAAIEAGFAASSAVCPTCPHRDDCDYHAMMEHAENATHSIATHQRAALGFAELAAGKQYIVVAEDSAGVLRPIKEVADGMHEAIRLFERARWEAMPLGVMADSRDAPFFEAMERAACAILAAIDGASQTSDIEMPMPISRPHGIDATLWRLVKAEGFRAPGDVIRVCKAAAAGELAKLVVRVDTILLPGSKPATRRAAIAVWQTTLPDNATIWIDDHTANPDDVERMAGRPVVNRTPSGRLEELHGVLQIPLDVKKSTGRKTVVKLLRGMLASLPYDRIGIIADKIHVPAIDGTGKTPPVLDEQFRRRIARVEHFRSGQSRGSNEWLDQCDCIVVLGTPRVPPSAIRNHLIRIGKPEAAARSDEWVSWGPDYWSAETVSGERQTIRTAGYRDHDWHGAHQALVHAELIQAIGRGRAVCENGLPVYVVTMEELGRKLVDRLPQPISDHAMQVFLETEKIIADKKEQENLTAHFPKGVDASPEKKSVLIVDEKKSQNIVATATIPKRYLLEKVAVSSEIAKKIGKPERHVRKMLGELAEAGLVHKIGERGGWGLGRGPSQPTDPIGRVASRQAPPPAPARPAFSPPPGFVRPKPGKPKPKPVCETAEVAG